MGGCGFGPSVGSTACDAIFIQASLQPAPDTDGVPDPLESMQVSLLSSALVMGVAGAVAVAELSTRTSDVWETVVLLLLFFCVPPDHYRLNAVVRVAPSPNRVPARGGTTNITQEYR